MLKRVLLAAALLTTLTACRPVQVAPTPSPAPTAITTPAPTNAPTNTPTDPPPTATAQPSPTGTLLVLRVPTKGATPDSTYHSAADYTDPSLGEIVCPTENDAAMEAYNAGILAEEAGRLDLAEQNYLQALELDPGYCDAMDNLGLLLRTQDRVEEAITWYQRSLEVAPGNILALVNLGAAYRYNGQYEEAAASFQRILELEPGNPEGYYGLGLIYYLTSEYDKAIDNLERAGDIYFEHNSDHLDNVIYLLGLVYVALENYDEAAVLLAPLYKTYMADAEYDYALGLCLLYGTVSDIKVAGQLIRLAEKLGKEIPGSVIQDLSAAEGS